ncbi:MAG: S41 family peptidase [Synechococcales cyanobacterium]
MLKSWLQGWLVRLVVVVCGAALLLSGIPVRAANWGDEQKLVATAWALVDRAYVDAGFNGHNWWTVRQKILHQPLLDRQSTYHAIEDMLAVLDDPFTRFLDKEHYHTLQSNTSGELNGVGLQIVIDDQERLTVIAPIEGSPAERAGLRTHDHILAIDHQPTTGLNLDEAAEKMRGKPGDPVHLQMERDRAVFEVTLVRETIPIHPVDSKILEHPAKVAYIRLNQFNGNAVAEVETAIRQGEAQHVKGYILDLRNNPGGLLQAAIEIAQMWLDHGDIVLITDRNGIQDSISASRSALTTAPLVVLVDRGSASASEVLAGALQDNHRATLVGSRTFGKGLIQSLFDLPDGSGLAITTARYVTPSGRDIHKLGIQPDVVVERATDSPPLNRDTITTDGDTQFQAALQLFA